MKEEFVVYTADEKYLIDYLLFKVKQQDWSAVSNVANDLRELRARKEEHKKYLSADSGLVSL